jgi:hypothetical protein
LESKTVVTPKLNYQLLQSTTSFVPGPVLEDIRLGIRSEPAYIAQHLSEYSCTSEGTEQIGEVTTAKFTISVQQGGEFQWSIDPATGRLLRSRTTKKATGSETIVDYSDWRLADGMYIAFKRHFVENGHPADSTMASYEVNPTIDPAFFAPPAQSLPAAKEKVEVHDKGQAWLDAQKDPAGINVNGAWDSEEWGVLHLRQTAGSREVIGSGGGYYIKGIVSGNRLFMILSTDDAVEYCAVLSSEADNELFGSYSNRKSRLSFAKEPCQEYSRPMNMTKK